MASNTQHLAVIFFLSFVMLSTGVKFNYLKYCGPPDKTLKYEITPWPIISPGDVINITVTFTPAVDVFDSTLQFEIISKETGQIKVKGLNNVNCDVTPRICNLAAGETYSLSYKWPVWSVPSGYKGTFIGTAELFNQDQVMWFCVKTEAVF